MSWFSRNVLVAFINDATSEAFDKSKMPPANLPESFVTETTLHIGDADWSVIHAEPQSKKEFNKSGALTLRLRKIELIDPGGLSLSQFDFTDRFDDNANLCTDEWISTTPLNSTITNPEASGLPSPDAVP